MEIVNAEKAAIIKNPHAVQAGKLYDTAHASANAAPASNYRSNCAKICSVSLCSYPWKRAGNKKTGRIGSASTGYDPRISKSTTSHIVPAYAGVCDSVDVTFGFSSSLARSG